MSLHIRQKKNSSGTISIQIIDRTHRQYKVVETIACVKNDDEKRIYLEIAQKRLEELNKELYPTLFDTIKDDDKQNNLEFISLANRDVTPIGDELIYGKIFKYLGCDKIALDFQKMQLFKSLVISRILYPGSKLYLIDYLEYFKKEKIDKNRIYRFLDTIYQEEIKQQIEQCVFEHTKKIMQGAITVTFYDVTTLYFESESEDDLRRIGFSKEGKVARPQILLGLFTTLEGHPLSFELYEGNKYEGHTLVDILQKFQTRFHLKNKPIVVADRGMLTHANIAFLENNGYKYILAYKIKNIDNNLKERIANLTFLDNGTIHTIEIEKEIPYKDENDKKQILHIKQKLILSYSTKRAKKDKRTREKALEKIKAKLSKKNITKSDLKLSYYAKYLDIDDKCNIKYKLNPDRVMQDERLDGIKGFATNDFTLSANDVIAHYQNQYDVEKAFRISKTDLRIRPIYHRIEERIKAHVLISFVSYAVYKEFERRLKLGNVKFNFSQKLLRDIIKHMFALNVKGKFYTLSFDEIQQKVYDAINT
ncbi:IS1634 family transposase [Sulfurimonas sp. SWIR-19]|uniref:IS1634 family transposase n=1 Tax=Sulfurimonas sp. SWIR-19 TaxID=2878390 RepID=UPI001CF18990|nr:IS1634 family transposase [Sulfurimonas sp. SWIR-19]UCM99187.1 IS1634 family transposase [Sulfurimonas sp. SWIR-19]UCM99478.1 IS1634 family transposase [Sulfurimonas sp. SWIR-19]UCM99906.1 IS1634 family transposase [Sulfurimonas sp. SWIR-19]